MALCNRRGARPQKPLGAGPPAIVVGLGGPGLQRLPGPSATAIARGHAPNGFWARLPTASGASPSAISRGPARNGFWGPTRWRLHSAHPPTAPGAQPHADCTRPYPQRLLGPCPQRSLGRSPQRLPPTVSRAQPPTASEAQPHGDWPIPQRHAGPSPMAIARDPAPNGIRGPAPRRLHGALSHGV